MHVDRCSFPTVLDDTIIRFQHIIFLILSNIFKTKYGILCVDVINDSSKNIFIPPLFSEDDPFFSLSKIILYWYPIYIHALFSFRADIRNTKPMKLQTK